MYSYHSEGCIRQCWPRVREDMNPVAKTSCSNSMLQSNLKTSSLAL